MGSSQSAPCYSELAPDSAGEQKIFRPHGVSEHSRHVPFNDSCCTLYNGIVSLVQNNKYADLLILCGDDRYPVHRAILCPRSHFFEEHCAVTPGELDLASPTKPTKIWIDPADCESHVLAAVLNFVYTLNYSAEGSQPLTFGLPEEVPSSEPDESTPIDLIDVEDEADFALSDDGVESIHSPTPTPSRSSTRSSGTVVPEVDPGEAHNQLVFHVQVYRAAHWFGIKSLRDVAKDKFEKRLRSGPWKTEMILCIREVYIQGNDGRVVELRERVVQSARSRFRMLKICPGFDDLVSECPEFSVDLLKRM